MNSKLISLTAAGLVLVLGLGNAFGQDSRAKAREVFNKAKDSVVWVSVSLKVEASSSDGKSLGAKETKTQAVGTVIDPSGLTVVSLSVVDPASGLQGRSINTPNGPITIGEVKSEYSEVKITLPDGTEIPSQIVLKDLDLDLAFIRPEKETKFASFTTVGKNPDLKILDEIVCLFRMPKALDQTPVASLSEISGIINKPRLFYIGGRTLGGPVYATSGQFVGITVSYKSEVDGNTQTAMVIAPAEDIAKGAKEAMTKKIEPASQPASQESTTKEAPKATIKIVPGPGAME